MTNVTQVVKTTHGLGYAASRLLFYAEPTDRALIGWQPISGAGHLSIGGWERTCECEARTIVDAVNTEAIIDE